jgi:hypothetical protein
VRVGRRRAGCLAAPAAPRRAGYSIVSLRAPGRARVVRMRPRVEGGGLAILSRSWEHERGTACRRARPLMLARAPPPRAAALISRAITALGDRTGSSVAAIEKYLIANHEVGDGLTHARLRTALKCVAAAARDWCEPPPQDARARAARRKGLKTGEYKPNRFHPSESAWRRRGAFKSCFVRARPSSPRARRLVPHRDACEEEPHDCEPGQVGVVAEEG